MFCDHVSIADVSTAAVQIEATNRRCAQLEGKLSEARTRAATLERHLLFFQPLGPTTAAGTVSSNSAVPTSRSTAEQAAATVGTAATRSDGNPRGTCGTLGGGPMPLLWRASDDGGGPPSARWADAPTRPLFTQLPEGPGP